MTSLDMNGISLTVLKLDPIYKIDVLKYIDLPVDSPFWPKAIDTNIYYIATIYFHLNNKDTTEKEKVKDINQSEASDKLYLKK